MSERPIERESDKVKKQERGVHKAHAIYSQTSS